MTLTSFLGILSLSTTIIIISKFLSLDSLKVLIELSTSLVFAGTFFTSLSFIFLIENKFLKYYLITMMWLLAFTILEMKNSIV